MAKYEILKNFTDKYDESIKYKVGKVEEFTDERAKEILKKGKLIKLYVEPVVEVVEETTETAKTTEIVEESTEETTEEVVEDKKSRKRK